MSAINEAIFRGRRRPAPMAESYDTLRRSHNGLTEEFISRKAVEAVLAGGYTKCEAEAQASPEAHRAAPERSRFFARNATLWACLFALAGLIGMIGISRAVRGTVQAKQADRAALSREEAMAEREAILAEAAAAAEAEAAKREAQESQPPMTRVKAALPAPAPQTITIALKPEAPQPVATQVSVALRPVNRGVTLTPVTAGAMAPAGVPDDQPIAAAGRNGGIAGSAGASATGGVQLEEVLYEGEPASASTASAPAGAGPGMARRAITVDQDDEESAPAKRGKAGAGGKPQIEGIFYDKVRPMAIINGDIVEIGKAVGTMKVADIQPGLVVLTDSAGARVVLRP